MRALILAEKPSVARDIARVLKVGGKGEGYLANDRWVVSWALGHLVTLCEPDELDPAYKKWRVEQLPMLPDHIKTKVVSKTRAQFSVVKKLLLDPDVDRVVCATDSGREGELIFRYIYEKAGCKKPVTRLWISSMTDAAIREGFAHLKPSSAYDALYVSAKCRSEADWLIGMNATRAYTLRYDALLSIGRVQTPTLKIIVDRDHEISAFVPEPYYEVRADFGDYQGLWFDPEHKDTRCRDQALAERIKREVVRKPAVVAEVRRERKSTPPPQLFDLTALQRACNRAFGLSAAKTLEIAQSLYEKHKALTYPRTDSRYLTRDMIPKVQSVLAGVDSDLKPFADALLPNPPTPTRVYQDAQVRDHHAIIPTGQKLNPAHATDLERKVYDMVARRLIAALYPNYEYESAIVTTNAEGHAFRTTGRTPLIEGWRALYRNAADAEQESAEPPVPALACGDQRTVASVKIKACKTKPPAPHTDASLLDMMERAGRSIEDEALRERMKDSGLGTPATRAAIIERLIAVGYIVRKGKTLLSTEKGQNLIGVVPSEIASPETTGRWERALYQMAGETDAARLSERQARFIGSIHRFATFLVESAVTAPETVRFEREARKGGKAAKQTALGVKCPLCGEGDVLRSAKAYGCSRWKSGCKLTLWRNALDRYGVKDIPLKMARELLSGQSVALEHATATFAAGNLTVRPK